MKLSVYGIAAALLCLFGVSQKRNLIHSQTQATKTQDTDSAQVKAFWDSMNQVTQRGKELYGYDQAAWHGTDAVLALNPDKEGLTRFLCTHGPKGWVVTFPAWNAAGDKLLIRYQATETEKPNQYQARKFDPPLEAPAEMVAMERALNTAWSDFGGRSRPYNHAILPAPDGFFVYLYPAQTEDHVYPVGGDVRYTVSSDGKQIVEKHQMHKTVIDFDFKKASTAGFHTHVLSSLPEDTDVFLVLTRTEHIPEYIIINPEKLWVVMPDGTIGVPLACVQPDDLLCTLKPQIKEAYERSQQSLRDQPPAK